MKIGGPRTSSRAHHPRRRGRGGRSGLTNRGGPGVGLARPEQDASLEKLKTEVGTGGTGDGGHPPAPPEWDAKNSWDEHRRSGHLLPGPSAPSHRARAHRGTRRLLRDGTFEDNRVVREREDAGTLAFATDPPDRSGLDENLSGPERDHGWWSRANVRGKKLAPESLVYYSVLGA